MYKHLTSEQRYTLDVLLKQKTQKKIIAASIGVSESTISREIRRNGGVRGGYGWRRAQELSDMRKERLPGNRSVQEWVWRKIDAFLTQEQWSPEQISGVLLREGIRVSHETIYRHIRKDKARGGELYRNCRHRLKHRKRAVGACARIPNRTGIELRPAQADGCRFGDWEMDTIIGANGRGAILTLVERSTNYLLMKKLPSGKMAKGAADAAIDLLSPFIGHVKTITTDNGSEFVEHERIAKKIRTEIFFAHPYSSWEKGAVENANKLIRQYIPKGTDLECVTDEFVRYVQFKINRRPRKKLNFSTPVRDFYLRL